MERPAASLKKLLEAMSNTIAQGRPEESFRRAYDLPARRFAFNSFEVSFALPAQADLLLDEAGHSIYDAGALSLEAALAWLESSDRGPEPDISMLEVLKELVPPAHGQVTRTEVRGQLVSLRGRVVLTREDRATVTRAIGKWRRIDRELVKTEGRIGQFDKDHLTFILRDRSDLAEDLKCSFVEDQFDDLYDAFDGNRRIVLVGSMHASRNLLEVVAAEAVATNAERISTPLLPTSE
jgi:hypothetical protein